VGVEREENKGFRLFHKIQSTRTFFMTATEKTIETRMDKLIYSMEDETVFGTCIDVKSVQWAIEHQKITDYNILVLKNTEEEVDGMVRRLGLHVANKEIFISCYMCLKSFEKYGDLTHVLLYTNTTEEAELAQKYIDDLLSSSIVSLPKERLYNQALHSKNVNDLESEIDRFRNTPHGILSCVYLFGEGFDLPKLNGVCIAGNMQSETRIIQYLLRPNRLEHGNPAKKAYVIIPYIDTDDWEMENKSYEKIRILISHLRNSDEQIEQKMTLCVGNREKKPKRKEQHERTVNEETYNLEENEEELNQMKLRLRYSKALGSRCSEEQDEYNYVRSINSNLNIQSKKEYNESQERHSHFIASPEEYFKLKGVWNHWYDFMGVDTKKYIPSKQDWIYFCIEKNVKTVEDYYKCCEEYDILPREPADFYKDFSNIPTELGFHRNRRR
jgi:predicted helicase